MKINFTKSSIETVNNYGLKIKTSYGAIALAIAETAFVAKGFKDSGFLGGLKNFGILLTCEAAAWAPAAYLAIKDKTDSPYYKAYDKLADVIGTKYSYEEV